MKRTPPKEMAEQIVKLLQKQNLDPSYVKKIFQYIRKDLNLRGGTVQEKQLPELMTKDELNRFYKAVWYGSNRAHTVMLKLMLFTGIRNEELANIKIQDIDLESMKILIRHEEGDRARYVLFPPYFRDEFDQYINIQMKNGAVYLFETNRMSKFTTRWIREIVKKYAKKADIKKRIYPHLFRHQILTYLTSQGILDEKIQLISGLKNIQNLNIYKELSMAEIEKEYWAAMKDFPIQ